jgi:hypothetical protein
VTSSSAVAVAAPFIAASLSSPSSLSAPAATISTAASSIKVASYLKVDAERATDKSLITHVSSRITFTYYLKSFIDKSNNSMANIGWGVYAGNVEITILFILLKLKTIFESKCESDAF